MLQAVRKRGGVESRLLTSDFAQNCKSFKHNGTWLLLLGSTQHHVFSPRCSLQRTFSLMSSSSFVYGIIDGARSESMASRFHFVVFLVTASSWKAW